MPDIFVKTGHGMVDLIIDYAEFKFQHAANLDLNSLMLFKLQKHSEAGGSRVAATSKIWRFVIIVNGFHPLTIITKHSNLDVAAALDPLLTLSLAKN